MKTLSLSRLTGKTIKDARLMMDTPSDSEGDCLEISFEDGSGFTLLISQSLPGIEIWENPDINKDGPTPTVIRGSSITFHGG